MAWLRSALSKAADRAAEVGSKTNLTRAVRSYAGAVYHQAAGGAKIFQDRLAGRNSFKDAVKRLNEVSLNARGTERLHALNRWLAALKDIDREWKKFMHGSSSSDDASSTPASPKSPSADNGSSSPRKAHTTLFYDIENGGEPMTFRDVFLDSRALEHIVTSMILDEPVDEEVGVLSEIFGLCLAGGKELHSALISSIQDLAKAFSTMTEQIKIERSELLELAQFVITGLKLNPESERLDAEITFLQQQMAKKQGLVMSKDNLNSTEDSNLTEEVVQCGSRIRNCLRRKEELLSAGDTAESRAEKVNKLKQATEGISDYLKEIEQKVSENRQEKEKAVKYREVKAAEVQESEKALAAEVQALQKRKDELEAQLKEVNASLAVVTARHINIQEEKEQYDEASSSIVAQLSFQDAEFSRSITALKSEAVVAKTWLGFLEDTWLLQKSCLEDKTKDFQRDLQEANQQFLSIASTNLSYYQEEATLLLKHLKYFGNEVENNKSRSEADNSGKTVEEKYRDTETQAQRVLHILEKLTNEVKSFELREDGDDVEKKMLKNIETITLLKSEFEQHKRPDFHIRDDNVTKVIDRPDEITADGWEVDG